MKKLLLVLGVLAAVLLVACGDGGSDSAAAGPVTFQLWTQEGESDGGFAFVEQLAADFMAANPNITIEVVQKSTEALREDFQTASLAGEAPTLLWTVNDHAGPFTAAGIIQPVDGLFDDDAFVPSVVQDGSTWGVPITSGNHLMLLYNRDFVSEAPETTDELIALAQELTTDEVFGLVYNQGEPFWLAPWIGGFGGAVFESDGVTPDLDSQAMVGALQFLADLKFEYGIVPQESDYGTMDTLFKEGRAAMIINGDWSIGDYVANENLGAERLGIAPLPVVSSTGRPAAPYTAPKMFMLANGVEQAQVDAAAAFIEFATSYDNQVRLATELSRIPGLIAAQSDAAVAEDPILQAVAAAAVNGVPQPSQLEMRANWDAMRPELNAVLAGTVAPAEAAANMQEAAVAGIRALQ